MDCNSRSNEVTIDQDLTEHDDKNLNSKPRTSNSSPEPSYCEDHILNDNENEEDVCEQTLTRLASLTESGRTKRRHESKETVHGRGFKKAMSGLWNSIKRSKPFRSDGYLSDRKSRKLTRSELTDEQKMRLKLEYHFMTPFQKYKRGRKPWKLGIQVLKILIVTIQVSLFGMDRFASVSFFQHSKKAFQYLFIKDWDGSKQLSYFSKHTVIDAIHFANYRYLNIKDIALGVYSYTGQKNTTEPPPPLYFCHYEYAKAQQNASKGEFDYDVDIKKVCKEVNAKSVHNITQQILSKNYFEKVVKLTLEFSLNSIYLAGLKFHHRPECFQFKTKIIMDNAKNDGKIHVFLTTNPVLIQCSSRFRVNRDARAISGFLVTFDALVIFVCFTSCVLCIRSLVKSIMLAKKAKKYFKEQLDEELTRWDLFEFINKWFPVIVVSDCLSIAGSVYKIFVDERDLKFYNVCCILLALGVLFVWIGLLRFLTYLKAYNILLITLRVAAPALLRFLLCASFIFLGFTFCGWVVLGPYHQKFREFWITMDCLFSLLNGDDMFPTFSAMSDRSVLIWVFSKLYIYVFVSFFIYITLSTFISIVGDTYERLKDWGRLPQTRIEVFIEGKRREVPRQHAAHGGCHRCARSNSPSRVPTPVMPVTGINTSMGNSLGTLSASQLSLESASWE